MKKIRARLNEIAARKAEITRELNEADETRLAELNTETDALLSEEAELRSKLDLRGRLGDVVSTPEDHEENTEDEERAARIKETGTMTLSPAEVRRALTQRSITIATGSLAKPTEVGNNFEGVFNTVSSIVDEVRVQDCDGAGEWQEPYTKENSTAGARTDGTANASPSDPTFRIASIKPNLINITSYVSKNIAHLTPVAYAAKVQQIAMEALRKKIGEYIVNGDAGTFYGIKTAVNTENPAEAIYATLAMKVASSKGVIDETTLRAIVLNYGGDENVGANARLYLNKTDLIAFGAIRGTNDKKAVYEITPDAGNPNTGTIKDGGLIVPYTINSALTALNGTNQSASAAINTMLYGDPMNYELGLFGNYTIEVSKDYKFAEGLLTVMGEVMAGGNLIKHAGFIVCQIPKS